MIVITNELKNLFEHLGQKNLFHLPMTVNTKRFNLPQKLRDDKKFVFKYIGGGTYKRDGLENMVKAFIDLKEHNYDFEFHIVGPINKTDKYIQSILLEVQKSLSKEIITLLKSEELRCNLSTNAKEYVNQRWDGKVIMDSILIIYRNLICTFSNS